MKNTKKNAKKTKTTKKTKSAKYPFGSGTRQSKTKNTTGPSAA